MSSVLVDRNRANPGLALKAPVRVATTEDVDLYRLDIIDGVQTVDGDRVLVKDQTDTIENGIYIARNGTWDRAPDWDGFNDAVEGTWIFVQQGTANADKVFELATSGDINVGITAISFTERVFGSPAFPITIAQGGTGATTAAGARTALGVPGIPVAVAEGGTGATDAATARTNLGLGTIATQASDNVTITGGSVTGITDLAVADGGTGASDASTARTNLGLGTIATQDASGVTITGGSITGITDLAVADGGTGASTAADARTNLGLGTVATESTVPIAKGGTGQTTASAAFDALKQAATDSATGVVELATAAEARARSDAARAISPSTLGSVLETWAYDVKKYGAVGDGTTDDVTSINSAITACNAAGGGIVFFPPGTYLCGASSGSIGIAMMSNVHLVGAGRVATTIKLEDAADAHLINCASISNCSVSSMTLDGNRTTQTAGVHCIRGESLSNFTARDLEIKNAAHYGVGLQEGTLEDIRLVDLDIHDTGGDGIDMKNKNDDNEAILISRVIVRQWGLNVAHTIQAAIDCRGPCRISQIHIGDPSANDAVGLRFRQGELLDTNGFGAHRSTASGLDIRMGNTTSGIGIYVAARDVMVSDAYIRGGNVGVQVLESDFRGSSIRVEETDTDGFLLSALGSGLDANFCSLSDCYASGCGGSGFYLVADNCTLSGNYSLSNNVGITIESGSNGHRIIGGRVSGNTTSQISDSGTSTCIASVNSIVTENTVLSSTFAIDSTGTKNVTIAHGLSFTPDAKDVQLTVARETAVTDHRINLLQVDSVTATNINARVVVQTASATVGATARLAAHIKIKIGN